MSALSTLAPLRSASDAVYALATGEPHVQCFRKTNNNAAGPQHLYITMEAVDTISGNLPLIHPEVKLPAGVQRADYTYHIGNSDIDMSKSLDIKTLQTMCEQTGPVCIKKCLIFNAPNRRVWLLQVTRFPGNATTGKEGSPVFVDPQQMDPYSACAVLHSGTFVVLCSMNGLALKGGLVDRDTSAPGPSSARFRSLLAYELKHKAEDSIIYELLELMIKIHKSHNTLTTGGVLAGEEELRDHLLLCDTYDTQVLALLKEAHCPGVWQGWSGADVENVKKRFPIGTYPMGPAHQLYKDASAIKPASLLAPQMDRKRGRDEDRAREPVVRKADLPKNPVGPDFHHLQFNQAYYPKATFDNLPVSQQDIVKAYNRQCRRRAGQ